MLNSIYLGGFNAYLDGFAQDLSEASIKINSIKMQTLYDIVRIKYEYICI